MYSGALLLYRPLFMTELLIACLLFSFSLPKRKQLFWRIPLALVICYGACFAFPTISNPLWNTFTFLMLYLVAFGAHFLVFDADWKTILFVTIAGYNVQHASYELYDLLLRLTQTGTGAGSFYDTEGASGLFSTPLQALVYAGSYLLLYWLSYVFFGRRIKKGNPVSIHNIVVFGVVIVCLISDIVINSFVLDYTEEASYASRNIISALSLLLCVIALTMQFEVAVRYRLDNDIATLKVVRSKEREHYRISKENSELIALKAHDLRHQIRELGQRKEIAAETIEEISSLVDIYDSDIKTGNTSMDLILTEKSRICSKNKIRISIMAEGTALSMLNEPDTYSLLGNILDNAIEAVKKLPEDKRSISFSVKALGGLTTIKEENPYLEGELRFGSDGLPLTSKANKANHGYGVRSIDYVAKKYGGDLTISASDGIYSLSLLLPKEKDKKD